MIISRQIKKQFLQECEQLEVGKVTIRTPEGDIYHFGSEGLEANLEIHDWRALTATMSRGDIGFGEAYIAGLWSTDSIENVVQIASLNKHCFGNFREGNFWNKLKYRLVDQVLRANTKKGSSRNIKAHYDVGNEFYQLWLDESMSYSSALFESGSQTLYDAQMQKYDRILDNLGKDGQRILEIGCGWGGFAERAVDQGRRVTGLTISPSQKGYADARLDGRADILLQDYRDQREKHDHIVSIEMIEAVGQKFWPTYFGKIKENLNEGGKAIIQAITLPDDALAHYAAKSDFIRQYTFPGGMLLSEKAIADCAERTGLKLTQSFDFGQDYAETCRRWAKNLDAAASKVSRLGYSDAFMRNWRFYLGACAGTFAAKGTSVGQFELQHAN